MGTAETDRSVLDPTDIAMIQVMQENGRIAIPEPGRRVGLSQPATSERVKRLEEKGIISGYAARIDAAALGLGVMAVIRSAHNTRAYSRLPQALLRNARTSWRFCA